MEKPLWLYEFVFCVNISYSYSDCEVIFHLFILCSNICSLEQLGESSVPQEWAQMVMALSWCHSLWKHHDSHFKRSISQVACFLQTTHTIFWVHSILLSRFVLGSSETIACFLDSDILKVFGWRRQTAEQLVFDIFVVYFLSRFLNWVILAVVWTECHGTLCTHFTECLFVHCGCGDRRWLYARVNQPLKLACFSSAA